MSDAMVGSFGVLGLIVFLFLLILAILWFLLPFAVFGTKDKLATLIAETRKTNAALENVGKQISELKAAMAHRDPSSEAGSAPH